MSMTKRYLESLPADEQDAILGPVNPDEWTDDAENEPDVIERILSGDLNAMIHNLDLCVQEQAENEPTEEESAEWARALMEEEQHEIEREAFIKFLADALDGTIGEGAISVHVCGSLVLLTELRQFRKAWYFHKLASWPTAVDRFTERDEAPLVKQQPKGTKAGCFDV